MSFTKMITFSIVVAVMLFWGIQTARAEAYCFCSDNVAEVDGENWQRAERLFTSTNCLTVPDNASCNIEEQFKPNGERYWNCVPFPDQSSCEQIFLSWQSDLKNSITSFKQGEASDIKVGEFLPKCLFQPTLPPECRNVNIFIAFALNVVDYLFGIIGALAVVMLVYGGFTFILSQGNPESIQHGVGIIISSVIGILVSFSAYFLVQFLGKAVGLSTDFGLF